MKQLNHSPEAAAAVLGIPLQQVSSRIAWLRRSSEAPSPTVRGVLPLQPRLPNTHLAPATLP